MPIPRPRILIHGLNYAPEPVGAGKYTAEMAEWLAAHGMEVRVVAARPYYPWWRPLPRKGSGLKRLAEESRGARTTKRAESSFFQQAAEPGAGQQEGDWAWREERAGVRVVRCPLYVPAKPGGYRRLLHLASFGAASLPALAAQLAWKPQVVLAIAPTLAAAPAALALARLCGAPAWLHVQDLELDLGREVGLLAGLGGLALRCAQTVEQSLLARFACVSAVSREMLCSLERKGVPRERLLFLPNWTDTQFFRPREQADGQGLLQRLTGLEPGRAIALYSGSMGRKQDLDTVALAARILARDDQGQPAPLFVLCGEGPELERLRQEHGQAANLHFLPLQSRAEHATMLAEAHVHLLPQRPGVRGCAMPSKLASILASGGPVIATAEPGSELAQVVAAAGGLVVDHGDAQGLARAVARLAADPKSRREAGRAARLYALANMDKDSILEKLYSSLLDLAQNKGLTHAYTGNSLGRLGHAVVAPVADALPQAVPAACRRADHVPTDRGPSHGSGRRIRTSDPLQ